jgi:hypothetical protein
VLTARFELGVSIQFVLFSVFMGYAMSREVSSKSFMPKGRARTQGSLCGICGVKRDTGADHSPYTSVVSRPIVSPLIHNHIRLQSYP